MKVAAAPISWGVSELPAWGYRMTADRVLEEMKVVGFEATELGPPGYLPDDPQLCRESLDGTKGPDRRLRRCSERPTGSRSVLAMTRVKAGDGCRTCCRPEQPQGPVSRRQPRPESSPV